METSSFVITTSSAGVLKSQLWDPRFPIPLGQPFRWVLERTRDGIRVRDLTAAPGEIRDDSVRTLPTAAIEQAERIQLDADVSIQIRSVRRLRHDGPNAAVPHAGEFNVDASYTEPFRRFVGYAMSALGAIMILAWVWPQSQKKTEELIPPQYAKIVLKQPKAAPASGSAAKAKVEKSVTRAKDAAVVQAFRAKALQNAVSGLLKGGMSQLLAQSDFLTGPNHSAATRRMFNAPNSALKAGSPVTGPMNARKVLVASIGGHGIGGSSSGSAVGYGKGERAGVSGQGKSLVSIDSDASTVEEGLTRDEVGEVIHRHISEVRYCYESAMIRTPDIEGKLVVQFTIAGAGTPGNVSTAIISSSTLPDPRLDDCILRRLVSWKFPHPKGGIDVAVSYPFIFKTLGR